ncbi:MFS transporter [Tepidibacillus sp. LV47]|uniref:MFS transporter n=1 Tax=Tepidibacillus sp. LV47 TaxID=3398228 RepID=UPI003AB09C3F
MKSEKQINKDRLWTKDFILLSLSNLLLFFGFQMLLPTLPAYVSQKGGGNLAVGMVISLFTISAVLIRPFSGAALDLIGRKKVLMVGFIISLFAIGSYYIAITVLLVLFLRIVHGLGWGISSTTNGTVASDLIPAARRGEGMGYFGLSSTLAMAIGPMIGVMIIRSSGFGVLFFTSFVSTFLAFLLTFFIKIPETNRNMSKNVHTSFTSRLIEKRALFPSLLVLLFSITYGGIVSFITLFGKEAGIENVGWFFTMNALFVFITRPISGRLFDKKGHFFVLFPSAFFTIIGLILLSYASSNLTLILAAVFYGIGFGSIQPSLQAWTINRVSADRRGAANATFFSAFDLGIAGGAMVLGTIAEMTNYEHMYRYSSIFIVIYLVIYLLYMFQEKK